MRALRTPDCLRAPSRLCGLAKVVDGAQHARVTRSAEAIRLDPQTVFRLLREWHGSRFIEDKAEQGSGQTGPLTAHHGTALSTMSYRQISDYDVVNVI